MERLVSKQYTIPFILVTSLFFIWGFARSILDVLNKHFQELLSISIGESALIQGMTYLGYFLMAIPAGIILTKGSYRKGIVIGLTLLGLGALMFIPGEHMMSFPVFLIALFLIGCGLAVIETSANPYATELGPAGSAAGRLNLAQAFNGLGCIVGPVLVGGFLFSGEEAHVSHPYALMGGGVLIFALIFTRINLPEITPEVNSSTKSKTSISPGRSIVRLLRNPKFMLGFAALFFYEIAEISINSLFINYTTADSWLDKAEASSLLSFGALGIFMVARVAGSLIMGKIHPVTVLVVCAAMAVVSAIAVTFGSGIVAKSGLFCCYAAEAIMFPTIFALSIKEAGEDVKLGSSLLMMSPIGGAVGTVIMGSVADHLSMSLSFIVPAIGYCFVLLYSIHASLNYKK